ncbi:MAG: ArsR/SmtB family transcription factor [Dehalococcoidia bacterium]
MKTIEGLTAEEERAASLFRALGNPARIRIVTELAKRNACVAGDLVDLLPLAQSTVSQHLKVLKDAGIIRGTIEGGDACYCLDPETVGWLVDFCQQICGPGCGVCAPDEAASGYNLPVTQQWTFSDVIDLTNASPEEYRAVRDAPLSHVASSRAATGITLLESARRSILTSTGGIGLSETEFAALMDRQPDE